MSDDVLGVRRPEREMLTGFLDWYRQVVANKVEGLSRGQASTAMTPTGLSPLGIVKHLTWVEAGWFRDTFAGEPVGEEVSNPDSFRLTREETVESVVAGYHEECAHSRRITDATPSLDDLSARTDEIFGHVSLRWILMHMLEETARHAGHLDLMRETLDGRTGD
jgi:uncharacterized damage-inducible protein DinB